MFNIHDAIQDFRQARRQERLEAFLAGLAGKRTELLPYEEVRRLLHANQQTERGLQTIPLDAIVGSVGRYRDFSRTFLPKTDSDEGRWTQVKIAHREKGLPPIEVYQIGDVYFVRDGNHRVSIARQDGNTTIEAYVTEVAASVAADIQPDTELDELILRAEYADFLQQTELNRLRPGANLSLTSPGKYPLLWEHINMHRYYMGLERQQNISSEEAVIHWYDNVFEPTVRMIQEQGLLRGFPERTTADLYVWLAEHRAELEESLGWAISTPTAVSALAKAISPSQPSSLFDRALQTVTGQMPPRRNEWWIEQYLPTSDSNLFSTILLPLNPSDSGWHAIEQAMLWAKRGQAQLIGLYVVPNPKQRTGLVAQMLAAHFQEKMMRDGLNGLFKVEVGSLVTLTPRLARWADLVVLSIPALEDINAWETIQQTRGLMLLVPEGTAAAALERILLVDDDSPYSREALLVAAYLQRHWQVAVSIATTEAEATTAVLEQYELAADLVVLEKKTAVSLRQIAEQHACQLVVAGGYTSMLAFRQHRAFLDGLIKELGQQTDVSLLLCR